MTQSLAQFSALLSLVASAASADCFEQTDLQYDYEDRHGVKLDDRSCLECGYEHTDRHEWCYEARKRTILAEALRRFNEKHGR